jgi:hypothetical protein
VDVFVLLILNGHDELGDGGSCRRRVTSAQPPNLNVLLDSVSGHVLLHLIGHAMYRTKH